MSTTTLPEERNASGAGRHLLLYALGVWEKKGRKKVTLDPSEWP